MSKINFKQLIFNAIIIAGIFLIDRISKLYIIKLAEIENNLDVYLNEYLNLYLIWNKGIAFGLFSFDDNFIYNLITLTIIIITTIVLAMMHKSGGFQKYCLISIFAGSLGNLFDRIYYSAVPDFIDLHIDNFHWFIFNVADIFITVGIICLIYVEIFFNKKNND